MTKLRMKHNRTTTDSAIPCLTVKGLLYGSFNSPLRTATCFSLGSTQCLPLSLANVPRFWLFQHCVVSNVTQALLSWLQTTASLGFKAGTALPDTWPQQDFLTYINIPQPPFHIMFNKARMIQPELGIVQLTVFKTWSLLRMSLLFFKLFNSLSTGLGSNVTFQCALFLLKWYILYFCLPHFIFPTVDLLRVI